MVGHLDQAAGHRLLDPRDLVGHHHRHAGQRQFQGDGAGGRERRPRPAEGGVLGRLAVRRGAPGASQASARRSIRARWRVTAGSTASIGPKRAVSRASVGAEDRHQPLDLGAARTRQDAQDRRPRPAGVGLGRAGPQLREPLDQRVADIGAGRAVQAPVRLRLERQQGQHVVDEGAHPRRPPRPPGPDARARRSRRSGRSGIRLRTREATAWVKPGLSMMTRTSGRASTTSRTVWRMRRSRVRSRAATGR